MSVTSSISAAMEAVASKERIHKALLELQSYSAALVNFTVEWKELDDHFDNLDKLMQKPFEEIGGKAKENEKEKKSVAEESTGNPNKTWTLKDDVKPRQLLKSVCEKMDAKGLKSFLSYQVRKEVDELRHEVPAALRFAADPAKLVLQTLEGYYPADNGLKPSNTSLNAQRRACGLLLESLSFVLSPDEVSSEVKKDAQRVAATWKPKLILAGESGRGIGVEANAFLQLLASYGIPKEYKEDDLCELVLHITRRKRTPDLCRALGISHRIPDVVEKLISSDGKQIEALRFVYAFGLVEKFPPVPLLKAYLKDAKKAAQEIAKNGANSVSAQDNATAKERASLFVVINCIQDYKLESQMSSENLRKRVAEIEKAKEERKRSADEVKTQTQTKRPRAAQIVKAKEERKGSTDEVKTQNQTKRPRVNGGGGGGTGVAGTGALLPTHTPSNAFALSKSADFYLSTSVVSIPSYNLPGQGVYDKASQGIYRSSYGVGSNPASLSRSHLYPSDSLQSSLYGGASLGGSTNYGSYNIGSGVPPATSYRSSYLY